MFEMGCDRQFTCVTCRQTYNMGYGSYGTWLDGWVDGGKGPLTTYADFLALYSPH